MENYFHFIDDEELSKAAYSYLFTLCDRAEYLFDNPHGEADFATEAIGTPFESMILALEQQRTGRSWGMWGKILTFRLTDDAKQIIEHAGLEGMLRVWDRRLENLSLFKEGRRLYDTCSHEGYTDIDDGFLNSVSRFCEQALPQTALWQQIETRYAQITERSAQRLWEELDRLNDLDRQIDAACQRVIRQPPFYEMTFSQYNEIARDYFSEEIVRQLVRAGDYRALHPAGYPRVFRESEAFRGKPPFCESALWQRMQRELRFWQAYLQLHGRPCPPQDEDRAPTISIIINEECE